MTSLTLTFNDVNFSPVQHEQQIWLSSGELAQALGYKQENAVSKIFNRNSEEFTEKMTQIIDNPQLPNLGMRIFSLRGCHLIAMFARTSIAKQFRKWVLDILDKEVTKQQIENRLIISAEQQALLHEIVDRRSKGERKIYAEMWSRHNRHFKIPRYSELLAIHFPDSVHYLETMEIKAKPSNVTEVSTSFHNNAQGLAIHMIWLNKWWREFGEAIRVISPRMAGAINDHFTDGACFAYHFVDKSLRLAIDEDAKYYPWHLNHTERLSLNYKAK